MKKISIYLVLACSAMFSGCSTELDVTGDWKETMVIYGLLDQGQDTQYVKINKAFLGQGDATAYAQVKDSVQFVNALTVQIQRIKNGSALGAPIMLVPTNIPKDPGAFYGPDQVNAIYSFSRLANPIFTDSEYKLTVTNSETNNVATAQTPLVEDFMITKPNFATTTFYFVNPISTNWPFVVEWESSENGRLYELNLRFNYMEYYDYNGDTFVDDSATKYVDWKFPAQTTSGLTGGQTMTVSFPGKNYLQHIGTQIASNPDVWRRKALMTDVRITGGADDLNTFITVNEPSSSLVQERPEFTNIENGLGIFSSRFNKPPFSRFLEANTLDELSDGPHTKCLRFMNASGNWVDPGGCP